MTAPRLLCLLFSSVLATAASAETLYEREFKRLSDQRDSDLAAYTLKVNSAYRAALEKLLVSATQAKDYDTVAKVVDAMKTVSDAAPPDPMAPGSRGGRIEQLLTSGTWRLGELRHTFRKNGDFSRVGASPKDAIKGTYKVKGDTVTLEFSNGEHHGLLFDEKSGTFTYSNPGFSPMDGKPFTPGH